MTAAKGTVIVTGANGGLGSAISEQIASKPELSGYYGLYLVRDAATAPALTSALASSSLTNKHKHDIVSLDLTNLDNVRLIAQDINSRVSEGSIPPIRALVLNAGFQDFGNQAWTSDGYDVTFAANYLGHWLLTLLLLKSLDKEAGRIVVLGSQAHDPSDPRNARTKAFEEEKYKHLMGDDEAGVEAVAKGSWSSAKEDPSFRGGFRRYGASKLCLIMMMYALQRRMDKDVTLNKVSILAVDPGTMITGLQRLGPWVIRVLIFGIIYPIIVRLFPNGPVRTPQRSASDILDAAFASGLAGADGDSSPKGLYFDGGKPLETSTEAKDTHKQELVWKETIKYTHMNEGETILSNWP